MKILVIALSGIGDALMFTPTLDKIVAEFPDAQIDVLAMFKGVQDIFEKLPNVSNVHYNDFIKNPKMQSLSFVLKLRKKYDVSINVYPSNRKEYNLISWLIGAKKRLAAKYIRKDFSNLGFLNNVRIPENDLQHNVETNFKLFEKFSNNKKIEIPALKIVLENEDIEFAKNFLVEKNITENDLVIGFHPGCATLKNHSNRRWAVEKFAELGKKLIDEQNAKILLFGGGEEEILKQNIFSQINSANAILVNAATLISSAAIMKRCNLFITNDSSLMHISSALKLNVIPLIGPTNIHYIHPWQTNYCVASINLDCSPCFFYSPKPLICNRDDMKFKCIKELSVDYVYQIAKNMLGK
ncbi:MAG: glycosyltransferase family 9 protein [Firmicutes bacterium]|nr:glycosyltransferase family 9 protein [Bacillota bacterium]